MNLNISVGLIGDSRERIVIAGNIDDSLQALACAAYIVAQDLSELGDTVGIEGSQTLVELLCAVAELTYAVAESGNAVTERENAVIEGCETVAEGICACREGRRAACKAVCTVLCTAYTVCVGAQT